MDERPSSAQIVLVAALVTIVTSADTERVAVGSVDERPPRSRSASQVYGGRCRAAVAAVTVRRTRDCVADHKAPCPSPARDAAVFPGEEVWSDIYVLHVVVVAEGTTLAGTEHVFHMQVHASDD